MLTRNYATLVAAILEVIPGAAVICDREGGVLFANNAARRVLPILGGRPCPPPEDWRQVALTDTAPNLYLRFDGMAQSGLHHELESELQWERQQRRRLESIIETLDEGVHALDENGVTVVYNKAVAMVEGRRQEDVLGRPLLNLDPDGSPHAGALLQAISSRKPTFGQHRVYANPDAQRVSTINHTIPLELNGASVGAVEIVKDITMIERLYREGTRVAARREPPLAAAFPADEPKHYTFDQIVGTDERLLEAIRRARQAARTSSPILISGETGTGKEVFVQAIHHGSSRSGKPLVSVNCAALPENLLESILFGTARGSFTGSVDREGLFEQAEGGTLFLDELDSMNLLLQAKLLRVLEDRVVRRVGALRDRTVDVRVVAACGTDPLLAVELGKLRRDVYYRLAVLSLDLPPLRDRHSDITLLAEHFLQRFSRQLNRHIRGIAPEVIDAFLAYPWPGNVRELKHAIEGAINMVEDGGVIQLIDLPPAFQRARTVNAPARAATAPQPEQPLTATVSSVERNVVLDTLRRHNGNVSHAAKELGLSRQSLQYRLRKYGIQPSSI